MEKELFKEMYNEIRLDREQKNRIWSHLEAEESVGAGKRFRIPAFATICVCVILVIGAPVVAANSSVVQSLVRSFDLLNETKSNPTEAQKEIYAKYGSELENEIVANNVTLKLEAIISDGHNICIPFSANVEKVKLPDAVMEGIKNGKFLSVMRAQIPELDFDFKDDGHCFTQCSVFDSRQQKDGVISGCYLMTTDEREIKQGDVLQVIDRKKREEEERTGKNQKEIRASSVIDEITIDKVAESRNIPVKTIQKELPEGADIYKMQLSPFSFTIEGFFRENAVDTSAFGSGSKLIVELKDGSTVKQAATTGPSIGISEGYHYSTALFETPINPDDVAGIRMHCDNYNGSFDLWIPVGGGKEKR